MSSIKMFPEIQNVISKSDYINQEEKKLYQYPIIKRYLEKKINGWSISDFFARNGIEKIVLYAISEFTELVCNDIYSNKNFQDIIYICDKNYTKYLKGYKGFSVVGVDKLIEDYQDNRIDKIIICSIYSSNEIFDNLLEKGVELNDLITLNYIIFEG